jgi:hypothetical protein
MIRLPEGLPFQRFPRLIAYAMLAALVSTILLAADGAYRWYRDAGTQVAEPSTPERSVQAPEPVPAETRQADSPAPVPARELVGVAEQAEGRPDAGPVPNPISGSVPNPATGPLPGTAAGPVPDQTAPQRTQTKSSRQPKRQQARQRPAKQEPRDRAAQRRPVQAEKPPAQAANPNVYYERDTQLGFAPQLTKRTCNPATGQMPMQCYYPREGRERFPAKPLD